MICILLYSALRDNPPQCDQTGFERLFPSAVEDGEDGGGGGGKLTQANSRAHGQTLRVHAKSGVLFTFVKTRKAWDLFHMYIWGQVCWRGMEKGEVPYNRS